MLIWTLIYTAQNEEIQKLLVWLYQNHYRIMMTIAYRVLKNRPDAEDAVMETFCYITDHPDRFSERDWEKLLFNVNLCVKCRALDIFRKNRLRHGIFSSADDEQTLPFLEDIPDPDADLSQIQITKENKEVLAAAIDGLDEIYQYPILLKYYCQLSNMEIATLTGLDVNTVNGRIFRAKKYLRQSLIKAGYTK